ncbi:MAG: hypothetical protein LBC31_05125 [Treponema sp.]|nr:hypothetical protein [Treponema sp.]
MQKTSAAFWGLLAGLLLSGCKPQAEAGGFSAVKIGDTALFFWTDPPEEDLKGFEGVEISASPAIRSAGAAKGEEAAIISGLDPDTEYTFVIRTVQGKKKSEGVEPAWYDVYAAGYDTGSALLWKNGAPQVLSEKGSARALALDGRDIFAAGENGAGGGYWKNGDFIPLPGWSAVTGLAVDGGTLYAVGNKGSGAGNAVVQLVDGGETVLAVNTSKSLGYQRVTRRMAGVLNEVTLFSGGALAYGGGDVYTVFKCDIRYVLNHVNGSYTTRTAAEQMLFKNGERVLLNGVAGGNLYDVLVSVGDLYLAGSDNNLAAYWKNGERFILTGGPSPFAAALGLAVKGEDIYITGYDGTVTKIWKNGEQLLASDGSAPDTQGNAVALFGSLPLAAGYVKNDAEKTAAVIWAGTKTLRAIPLSDGSGNAEALSIAVVPRP